MEALALPEADRVYQVSVGGWGWQKEVQRIRVGGAPTSNETDIQVTKFTLDIVFYDTS